MKKQPKQKRSQDVVNAVLEAAARILSKFRLRETSTNKIANVAGVGIGSLYDYFPNKNSIAVALMDKRMEKIVIDFENLLHVTQGSLENLIDESIEFIAIDFLARRSFLREIFLIAPENGRMTTIYKARIQATKILENHLIAKHQKQTEWAKRKSFFLIHSLLGVLESYVILDEVNFEQEVIKKELRNLMRSIFELQLHP